jgi:hypothetical protein
MKYTSEKYSRYCRVSATVSRTIYDVLDSISDNIDFNQPKFARRMKRNRSIGSALAFVAELALTDDEFVEKLKKHMIAGGRHYVHTIDYMDRY